MGEILFFAVVAGVIGYKLYMALGHEDYRPQAKKKDETQRTIIDVTPAKEKMAEKVIEPISPMVVEEEKALAAAGVQFLKDIEAIKKLDDKFSLANFLYGAEKAFEMVLIAFSKGDRNVLAKLLSNSVYRRFEAAIIERERVQQSLETTLLAEPKLEIKRILIQSSEVRITVGIKSEQVNLLKNSAGEILEGDPSQTEHIYDEWTFARDVRVSDPNWSLVSTRAQ